MRKLLRPVAVLAAGAVVATTLVAPAHAAPDHVSGRWLERQLTDGLVHNENFGGFNDYGLTADVAFGLDAVGGHQATVAEIADAIAPHVDSWTTGVDFGSEDIYAGSVAKAVVLAQTAGEDPTAFGGVDLLQRLEDRVATEDPIAGRIQDSGEQDYSNTLGQAFAVLGLAEAGSTKAAPARKFLLKQQCRGGYFRLDFSDQDRQRQRCDAGGNSLTAPDTDTTTLTLVLLKALPTKGKRVQRAIKRAKSYLLDAQKDNGSFGQGAANPASNTNSTGLAAWALGDTGACKAAVKAARWVKGFQVRGKVRGTELAGEKGAIAYNKRAMDLGSKEGITVATRDQWRRATSQAAPGLTFTTVKRCRR